MRSSRELEISFSHCNTRQQEGLCSTREVPQRPSSTCTAPRRRGQNSQVSLNYLLFCTWLLSANYCALDCSPQIIWFPVLHAQNSQWNGIKALTLFIFCRSIIAELQHLQKAPWQLLWAEHCAAEPHFIHMDNTERTSLISSTSQLCASRTSWNAKNETLTATPIEH